MPCACKTGERAAAKEVSASLAAQAPTAPTYPQKSLKILEGRVYRHRGIAPGETRTKKPKRKRVLDRSQSTHIPNNTTPLNTPLRTKPCSCILTRTFMTTCLREGFRVGFPTCILHAARANMQSGILNPAPCLAKECAANRVLGPLPPTNTMSIHVSRFSVIHQPGKWRLILDLSFLPASTVNDGIPCSLKFTTVDDAVRLISRVG